MKTEANVHEMGDMGRKLVQVTSFVPTITIFKNCSTRTIDKIHTDIFLKTFFYYQQESYDSLTLKLVNITHKLQAYQKLLVLNYIRYCERLVVYKFFQFAFDFVQSSSV